MDDIECPHVLGYLPICNVISADRIFSRAVDAAGTEIGYQIFAPLVLVNSLPEIASKG